MTIASRLPHQTCSACHGTGLITSPARQFQIGPARFVWIEASVRKCAQPGHGGTSPKSATAKRLAPLRARVHYTPMPRRLQSPTRHQPPVRQPSALALRHV